MIPFEPWSQTPPQNTRRGAFRPVTYIPDRSVQGKKWSDGRTRIGAV